MVLIDYIKVDRLHEHPDNPRKDPGDLTELTESIRKNGILQNLTVVPYFEAETGEPAENGEGEGHYRVIIGHRRLAAAKRAGLDRVPCAVEEMEYKKQISTMLLENMQRTDLTPYEQAQGFQMMMDLGSSVAEIVKDTGFSETTVRHRLKLMELDKDLLQEKSGGNIQMKDLIQLERIEDPEKKNELLEALGTHDFRFKYTAAIRQQEAKKRKQAFRDAFGPYVEIEEPVGSFFYSSRHKVAEQWDLEDMDLENIRTLPAEELCRELEAPLLILTLYYATLYQEIPKPETETEPEEKERRRAEAERRKREKELQEVVDTMRECRMHFARHIAAKTAKEHMERAVREMGFMGAVDTVNWNREETLKKLLDFREPEEPDDEYDEAEAWEACIKEHLQQYPEVTFFQITYSCMETGIPICGGTCCIDTEITALYDFLKEYGYERSDTERQILDGTHPLCVLEEG